MKSGTHLTIGEIEKSVQTFFDCQQNETQLNFKLGAPNAEEILLQHLALAFQFIDRSTD